MAVKRRRSGLWLAMFGRECHRDAATAAGRAPPHDLTLLHDRPRKTLIRAGIAPFDDL